MNNDSNKNPISALKPFDAPVTAEEMKRMPGVETRNKRTRTGKIFNLGRGLHQAVIFADPVHYQSKATGQWEEIDNTLIPVTDAAGNTYLTNRANDELNVEFHPTMDAAIVLLQDSDNHLLAWQLEQAAEAAPVHPPRTQRKNVGNDLRRDALEKLEDEVCYPNIFPGVDLRCRVQGVSFKDELVFSTPESVRPVTFILAAPDLRLEQKDSGDVELIASTGKTAFILPAPFMKDSKPEEAATGAVACSLAPTEDPNLWRLTYVPDAAWLATAQFPVILDPAVITQKHSTAIEDNFVTSAKPSTVQPYAGEGLTISKGSSTWGTSKAYIRFLDSNLPAIDSSYYVTKAELTVMTKSKPTSAANVMLKEVLGSWSSQTITWNNAPALADMALDYTYMEATGTSYTYDISNLVRKWYTGVNYGFALESSNNTYLTIYSSDQAYHKPYVVINYVSLAGLEDYLAYDEQSVGRAGKGYVSLYNGNLIFQRQDTLSDGNRMPLAISRFYNSCYRTVTDFGVGKGWKLNIQQCLHRETLDSVLYYVYTDGDGTRHHFRQVSGAWKDQSGLGLTLTISGSTATITDKGNNTLVFDLPTVEFSGNYANVKMLKSITDACGNTAAITTSGRLVTGATDGAGRATTFSNSGNRLAALLPPGYASPGYSGFTYDGNGCLTSVWEVDGQSGTVNMTYTYNSLGLLTSAKNHDGLTVAYEYTTAREPYRVKQVTISNGSAVLSKRSYDYRDCLTVVTDLLGGKNKKLYYHFNDYGNVVSVNDELGYACFAKYSDSLPVNHPECVSRMQKVVCNLFKNHGFSKSAEWSIYTNGGTGTTVYDTEHFRGVRSMKMNKTNNTGNLHFAQNATIAKGKPYTVSGYIKGDTAMGMHFAIRMHNSEGAFVWINSPVQAATGSWQRVSYTFTVPTSASDGTITVCMCGVNGPGSLYFDALQLEEGPVANSYNMLLNGDFSFDSGAQPADWLKNSTNDTTTDKVYTTYDGAKPAGLSANTMRIYGTGRTKYAGIYQDIAVSGNQGDVFVAGGWSLNHSKPRKGENFRYNIRVAFLKAGTTSTRQNTDPIEWSEEWTGWQFAAGPVVAPCAYSGIRFNVDYERNINYTDFDGFFLHKEEFGSTYQYDSKGNVLATKNAASLKDGATYDSFNNLTSYFQPGRSSSVKTTLEWGSTDTERKKHLLRKSTSPLGTVSEFTYDAYGNGLTSKTTGGSAFMQTKATYTSDGNHAATQTDARGKVMKRTMNTTLDTLTSVTDPRGQTVSYTYNRNKRITRSQAVVGSSTYRNDYAYTKDKLTQVKHNTSANASEDVAYNFAYDTLNRPTTVKVGTQTLSTTAYNADGTVASVTYGNGGKAVYSYDDFKRQTGIRFDSETTPHFSFIYGANGGVAQVQDSVRGVTVRSEYDAANRPMRKTTMQGNTHVYTGEVNYDLYNNLASFKEQVGAGRTAYNTAFTYDNENRPTNLNFGGNRTMAYTYDALGRVQKRTVNVGSTAVATTYGYLAGGHGTGSTTPLVQTISQPTGNLTYAYDDAGNITSVNIAGSVVSYTYDMLGQLTRVNDPKDTTAGSTGTTWLYTYDLGGNILSKKAYAYTTGTVGTAVQSNTYTYGDANWKDKLTTYNGKTISYDAIGNPTSDGTWTYTWAKGRQLTAMSKSGTSISYVYNEDGLRAQKNVNGTVTNYVLHGKNVVHLTQGSNNLHFFYGADGTPAIVEYNGVSYGYVKNLQGDIIAIVNASGAAVVQYTYDAWGRLISKTGSLASTLGTLNPFRYRGYVYDEETGLYYLRSRYYNSVWGRFVNMDASLQKTRENLCYNLYAYCSNNPICYVDPSGKTEVYFNVYLSPKKLFDIGHTDISIGDVTYTYGRYDPDATWGIMGMMGDGVLEVGPRQLFIEDQLKKGRAVSSFQIDMNDDEVTALQTYLDNIVSTGTVWTPSNSGRSTEVQRYKFASGSYKEYHLFNNNCTTFALDALRNNVEGFPASIYGFVPSLVKQKFAENAYLKSFFTQIVKSVVEYGY